MRSEQVSIIYSLSEISREKDRLFNLPENMFRKQLMVFAGGSQVNSHSRIVRNIGGIVLRSREEEVFKILRASFKYNVTIR